MQIGLYLCLRLWEYTKTNPHWRTTQFRLRNIQFQGSCGAMPFDAPTSHFLNVLVVTFSLNTQFFLSVESHFTWSLPVCLLADPWWHAPGVSFICATTTLTWILLFVFILSAWGLQKNPPPETTLWRTFGFGMPTLDSLNWGSTYTKLDLTPHDRSAQ